MILLLVLKRRLLVLICIKIDILVGGHRHFSPYHIIV